VRACVHAAVTLYTCIQEVIGSEIGRDTGYLRCEFSWLFSLPPDRHIPT
jgi:hypothetical protein